jgi:CHAT domain-containing protein
MQLQNIGNIYYTFGEWRKALKCYNQALPIYQAAGERKGEGQTLINIGNLHYGLGEARKALDYYLRALPILRAARDRTGEAITINNIGSAYFDLGEKQKALAYYLKALSIFRDLGYRVGEAGTLSHIGEAYAGFGKHQKALEYYDQALSIERAIGSQGFEADTDYHMMRAWNALSKPRLAVLYGKRAVALCQELRANIRGLDKETQQAYLKTVEKVYRELANILAGQGRLWEAEQVLGLLKQEEYFEFVRRDAATAKALEERADLTPVERAALGQYEEAAEKVGDIGHRVEELRAIKARTAEQEAELGQLNKELEAASRTFGVVLREIEDELGRGRGARDVVEELRATKGLGVDLRRLGRDIVFLSTVVTEKCVWVILTTPTTQVAGKTDIGEEDLNRKVQAFRSALGDPGSDPVPLAREFYRILIKPVEKELRSASPQTVAWMLDGTLRYLPVAALHDGKRYLVERFGNVVLTPASRSRLELKPSPAWRALGLGVSEAVGGFRALPAVADELRAVVQEGSGESGALPGHRLLNGAFTRQALEEGREAGYQVMHIASHFDFNPGTAADSFLLLGDGSHLTLEDIRTEPEPLFAGVELLALSACETAMGGKQADGREVDGLGEEVQNLGAEAVLATLWPVADESTAELMAGFYRHRQEQRLSKAEALREAQLALLKGRSGATAATQGPRGAIPAEGGRQATAGAPHFAFDPTKPYAHPYFWAPFILIGNWR